MPNQPNKAFKVYQASAGSGKTYTIVKEYLKLCLKNEESTSNFKHILAITFTNFAANEMKAKIIRQLVKIIKSDPNTEAQGMETDLVKELDISREVLRKNSQTLFLKIIYNYSDFFICTIDSFVQMLARSFAKDLGLPNQFNVSIDQEEVADEITERIGEQIGTDNPYLTRIVEDFAENSMEEEKKTKVQYKIHDFTDKLFSEESFQKNDENPFEFEQSYKETLDFINDKVHSFEAHCQQFVKEFSDFLTTNGLLPDDFYGKQAKSPCLSIHKSLQKKEYPMPSASLIKVVNGETNWYSKELPTSRIQQLNPAFERVFLQHIRHYVKNVGAYHFYKSQRDNLSLYVLSSKIKAEMEAYIGEEQVVHISEFNKRINKIMGDFSVPFIYERLGSRFKHVFIDEFQDTSVLQWQNLIPLLHNGISSGQMSMVVGDGKQSIYRWRNGEVRQIVSLPLIPVKPEASEAFEEFEQGFINNFSFNNLQTNFRSFSNIIRFNNDFFESSLKFLSPELQKVYHDNDNTLGKEVQVKQLEKHKEPGYVEIELFDPEDHADEKMLDRIKELINDLTGKGFSMSDITILVRKNRIGSRIAEYLAKQGIPVVSADSILLKSSPKVRLIISTLDYLIHPDNPVAVATMNYYWNLLKHQQSDGMADGFFFQGPDPDAFKPLMVRSYSLYDLCAALIRLYGLDTAGNVYLNYLLDLVFQWQSADESGIGNFLEYWEKKKNKLAVASGKTDAVTVMTIHKSKGLEFKVVICPFVVDNLDDKKNPTLWASPEELGFEPIPNIEKVQFKITKDSAMWTAETRQLADQENAKVRLDNMNLNYVAFTRAKQRLHILSLRTKTPERSPLNAFLQEHPEPYGNPDTRMVVLEDSEEREPVTEFFYESKSAEWFDKISVDANPSMFWAHPEDKMKPQEWGDFVHQVLSEIRNSDDIDRALRPHIDAGVIDQAKADLLKDLFLQMATHPVIGDAFSSEAKVKNECDILLSNGEILRPDRYTEMPDKIYLLDYKTGQKMKKHHRQLRTYMGVVSKMVSKPVEGYLVYLGNAVEIVKVS